MHVLIWFTQVKIRKNHKSETIAEINNDNGDDDDENNSNITNRQAINTTIPDIPVQPSLSS